jgi:hypothetical protein
LTAINPGHSASASSRCSAQVVDFGQTDRRRNDPHSNHDDYSTRRST